MSDKLLKRVNRPVTAINPRVDKGILCTCLIAFFLVAGCAHYPVNQPLAKYDPDYGYRGKNVVSSARADDLLVLLTFSGGGTRAAAFSYGVLETLRDTEVGPEGNRQRLLDKVDVISAVSGGSFTAAYFGLFGERIFQDFESRFLKKDVQGDLGKAVFFNPYNWARLFSPYFDRSDLAAEYYDREIFGRATFADLLRSGGPLIGINATDMSHGTRLSFNQDAFDFICSDLSTFPVARACAASSAVPILLTPITLKNYAGSCGFRMPEALAASLRSRDLPDRRFDLANNITPFLDAARKPYLHLVDGGVADNLGLRAVLERVTAQGNVYDTLKAGGLEKIRKAVFIVVNAETEIDDRWDRLGSIPPFGVMVDSYSSIAISRYNVETIALLRESFPRWIEEVRAARCPAGKIDTAPGACGDLEFYLVEVKFDALPDPAERTYFKRLPTSFTLPPEEVDKLRQAARGIMSNARDFKRLVGDLGK